MKVRVALEDTADRSAHPTARGTAVKSALFDDYVRVTVILASVLFLVGLCTQFPLLGVRFAMIGVGAGLLIFAGVLILTLPGPP